MGIIWDSNLHVYKFEVLLGCSHALLVATSGPAPLPYVVPVHCTRITELSVNSSPEASHRLCPQLSNLRACDKFLQTWFLRGHQLGVLLLWHCWQNSWERVLVPKAKRKARPRRIEAAVWLSPQAQIPPCRCAGAIEVACVSAGRGLCLLTGLPFKYNHLFISMELSECLSPPRAFPMIEKS